MSSMETDGAKKEEEKSEIYSHNMTEAMGAGMFGLCNSLVALWSVMG